MKLFRVFTFVVLLFSISTISILAQEKEKGKLADFEKQVEDKSDSDDNDYNKYDNNDSDCDDDYDDNDIESVFAFLDFSGAVIHGLGNLLFVSEPEINSGYWDIGYTDFPYNRLDTGLFNSNSPKKFSIASEISYFQESQNLTGINLKTRLSPFPVFSFEIQYTDLTEKLNTRNDHLRLFNLFLNYNRFKHEQFSFWWGLGVKGLRGDDTYAGLALNLGSEIYPINPVSVYLNYSIGSINETGVTDFSAKLNYHIDRFKVSLGYQNFSAGTVSISGLTLGFGFYL